LPTVKRGRLAARFTLRGIAAFALANLAGTAVLTRLVVVSGLPFFATWAGLSVGPPGLPWGGRSGPPGFA